MNLCCLLLAAQQYNTRMVVDLGKEGIIMLALKERLLKKGEGQDIMYIRTTGGRIDGLKLAESKISKHHWPSPGAISRPVHYLG
jgi:hypothetical protein